MNGEPDGGPDRQPAGKPDWRVGVDPDRCIGSGLCAATAPGRFQLVAGVSRAITNEIEPDDAVIDAAETCPVEAITVRDAATADVLAPRP